MFVAPGRSITGADEDQAQFRVIDNGIPGITTTTGFPPVSCPGSGSEFNIGVLKTVGRIAWYYPEAPINIAIVGVVSSEIATSAEFSTTITNQDFTVSNSGGTGNGIGFALIDSDLAPDYFTSPCVQGHQATINNAGKYLVIINSHTAVNYITAGFPAQ